ncbi:tRNA (adenosine(37)-N6)-threonylcarbamoyltransferase complex ATPase subunit type 1 TsaE [Emticicia sp. 21SJ11W-3]|uniref:tRNA (adenosine(37)-N6)-threonylcarbamoyltransferase complex ATPase subunit type 1 TsaE n=1 Tax=Emticicia sp. 21SJ11W-3 TaxID=2916755 RepID=UPI00209FDCB3|nr:tRNA (adenosine(37)-N6)-threonylcarbamoyltransferase complex ATPase subunit type 1 TsaE [Emticicia sp. 21SJ11W-3]UTA67192.1 tRNA (adenosine(37)-N6)-threonylcarbamoyltransferase complex ATPase subunit type 1 TsaE [Emticicia sp. 21SJ11W-3]
MTYTIHDLDSTADTIIGKANGRTIWIFEGEMGAGKTTLIKAIGGRMGITGAVQSPTFSIVNEYLTATGNTVYHFDFYRLKRESEALDFGVEEYFDSGNICLLEWAEKVESLLPENCYTIRLSVIDEKSRNLWLN